MAFTEFGTNSPQAVKRWSTQLMRESLGKTYFSRFMGRSDSSIIKMLMDLEASPGDTIKYDLRKRDRSPGVNGDSRLKGFERKLEFAQDSINIDQKRNGHSFLGMSQQRTVHDLRHEGRASLSDWYAWILDGFMFAYLAGVAGDSNESVNEALGGAGGFAGNALNAPDADHAVDGSAGAMDLTLLDDALAKAKVTNPMVKPTMVNGKPKYVFVMHPYQTRSMKTATGNNQWNEIHQNASQRGSSNPIYTGALGEYNGIVLHESEFIVRESNLTHGVFLGACAGTCAFGNAYKKSKRASAGGGNHFSYREEEDDYGNEEGIAAGACFGIKKARFDSADFGVIRVSTTETAPA